MRTFPGSLPSLLRHHLRACPWAFAWLLLGEVAGAAVMNFLGPGALRLLVDAAVSPAGDRNGIDPDILLPALIYTGLFAMGSVIYRSMDLTRRFLAPHLRAGLTMQSADWVQRHSPRMFANQFAGGLSSMISDLCEGVPAIVCRSAWLFGGFAVLVAGFIATYSVHPLCALVFFIWASVFLAASVLWARRISASAMRFAADRSALTGTLVDRLSNAGTVRLFARYAHEQSMLGRQLEHNARLDRAVQLEVVLMRTTHDFSIVLFIGAMLAVLLLLHSRGLVGAGDVAMVLNVSVASFMVIWTLSDEANLFTEEWGKCKQALAVLATPHEITDAPDAQALSAPRCGIEFEQVTFQYQRYKPLFNALSARISAGEKLGLVGQSGSGKTSFVSLLTRNHEPQQGRICINGIDIGQLTQESLHAHIAVIPQDPGLFHRSVLDNIRYGRLDASNEEVRQAARAAHCEEFILRLPDGYQTVVGERGMKLSGGQRQRIAIARAVLKNAPVLILDEATSALDSVTEEHIQDALENLMVGRTVIVIAHRLSTLRKMDRILVFAGGAIVEEGEHATLLERQGEYARLWRMQSEGFGRSRA